jgi:hypothetical protein
MDARQILTVMAASVALTVCGAAGAKGKGGGAAPAKSAGADYRSAKSGRYVKKDYAEKNKDTTVRESRRKK